MATSFLTPNMNLTVAVPGQEPGPQWAYDINNSMAVIDTHDHSPGYGVQITPAGININSDLSFNTNNATNLRSARFVAQGSPLAGASDLGCIYVSGVDLYYNDESGNKIRITSGGTVNATSSGISSGSASATFVAGVLVVNAAATTPANIQGASFLLGNNSPGTNFVTLSPPSALASNYTITLPLLPSSNLPLSIDTSGNITAAQISLSQLSTAIQAQLTTAPTVQKFLSGSGTYTTPTSPPALYIRVIMVGAGGGGQNGSSVDGGAGGGAGAYINAIISSPSATYSYGVGAGGSAGLPGGDTTFGANTAGGGAGGGANGGAGGTPTLSLGAGISVQGGGGGAPGVNNIWAVGSGAGGNSALGGGAPGIGATNGGGATGAANTGGGGSGGNVNSGAGGSGGSGVVIVEEYYA